MDINEFMTYQLFRMTLSTLATAAVIEDSAKTDTSRANGVRVKKMKVAISYKGKTAGEGPLLVGVAKGNMSAAELAEALNSDPQGPDNTVPMEQAKRTVMPLALIPAAAVASPADTRWIRSVRFPWKEVPEGTDITMWVQNLDTGSLTTGTVVECHMTLLQEWLDD